MPQLDGDIEFGLKLTPTDVKQTASQLKSQLKSAFDATTGKELNANLLNIRKTMESLIIKSSALEKEMKALEGTRVPTTEYQNLDKELSKLQAKLDSLVDKEDKFLDTGGDRSSRAFQSMEYDIERVAEKMNALDAKKKELEQSGKAYVSGEETKPYETMVYKQEELNNQMRTTLARLYENKSYQEMINADKEQETSLESELTSQASQHANQERNVSREAKKQRSLFDNLKSIVKGIASSAKRLAAHLKESSKHSSSAFDSRKLKRMLNMLAKYVFGIRSLFMLYRKLRAAGKESLQALAKESNIVNADMSALMTTFSQLKYSIGGIIQPILHVLTPALQALGNAANEVSIKIANFVAALTGQKFFYKARKIQKDYAASLDNTANSAKEAEKALASYDKLEVISKTDAGSGGAGGGIGDAGEQLYELATTDFSPLEKLKKLLHDSGWYGVGNLLGTELRNLLEGVDWDKLNRKASKLSKSLANLINGFVEVPRLGKDIGATVAEMGNLGVNTVYDFFDTTHWDSIGNFMGDGINGFVNTFDVKKLGRSIALVINSAVKTLHSFINKVNWSKVGKFISDGIDSFFNDLNTAELGQTVSDGILGAIELVHTFFEETDFEEIGNKIGEFIKNLKWKEILGGLAVILWDAIKAAFSTLVGLIKSDPEAGIAVAAIIGLKIGNALGGNSVKDLLVGGLNTSIKGASSSPSLAANASSLGTAIGTVSAAAAAAVIGYEIGNWLYEHVGWVQDIADGIVEDFMEGRMHWWGAKTKKLSAPGKSERNATRTFNSTSASLLSGLKIPRLASGAVIPANNEFLAVLGDQRQGTNVETPLATIEQALRNVMSEISGTKDEINLNLDGKTIAKVVWDENQKKYKQTGVRYV